MAASGLPSSVSFTQLSCIIGLRFGGRTSRLGHPWISLFSRVSRSSTACCYQMRLVFVLCVSRCRREMFCTCTHDMDYVIMMMGRSRTTHAAAEGAALPGGYMNASGLRSCAWTCTYPAVLKSSIHIGPPIFIRFFYSPPER